MGTEELRHSIEELQRELNQLTDQGKEDLTNQHILKLSTRLDALIVQYLKIAN